MKIPILTDFKKKLNAGFNISFTAFVLLWCVIFILDLAVPQVAEMLIVFLMLSSALFLIIAIVAAILNFFLKPSILLKMGTNYMLILNSEKRVEEIKEKNDIGFSKNFIFIEGSLKPLAEITNIVTFQLIKSDFRRSLKIETKNTKSLYIEQSPKVVFDRLIEIIR
jgi:hypothetical protein